MKRILRIKSKSVIKWQTPFNDGTYNPYEPPSSICLTHVSHHVTRKPHGLLQPLPWPAAFLWRGGSTCAAELLRNVALVSPFSGQNLCNNTPPWVCTSDATMTCNECLERCMHWKIWTQLWRALPDKFSFVIRCSLSRICSFVSWSVGTPVACCEWGWVGGWSN